MSISSMPTEMLILAGGMGTRLRSVVNNVPKPMAPVMGKPFLELLVEYWRGQGIRRIVFLIGYMGEAIRAHFGDQYGDIKIEYVKEESLLGTGGAVRNALKIKQWNQDEVVLINGDTWYEVSLLQLMIDANLGGRAITMSLKPLVLNDRYGSVTTSPLDGIVTQLGDTPKKGGLINAGCYLLRVAATMREMSSFPDNFSLELDFLKSLVLKGEVSSSIQNARFLDIGVPDDYQKAEQFIGGFDD